MNKLSAWDTGQATNTITKYYIKTREEVLFVLVVVDKYIMEQRDVYIILDVGRWYPIQSKLNRSNLSCRAAASKADASNILLEKQLVVGHEFLACSLGCQALLERMEMV